jgi:hypothetical protein
MTVCVCGQGDSFGDVPRQTRACFADSNPKKAVIAIPAFFAGSSLPCRQTGNLSKKAVIATPAFFAGRSNLSNKCIRCKALEILRRFAPQTKWCF